MTGVTPSFRLRDDSLAGLSAFVDSFRADATRLLVSRLVRSVADEAARFVDENRLGIPSRAEGKGPLRDAVAEVRRAFVESYQDPLPSVDFDLELRVFLVGPVALVRFDYGNDDYLKLLSARADLREYGWGADVARPTGVKAKEWEERAALWAEADGRRTGGGMLFRLVDGALPAPKWTAVRKAVPDYETRVRRCARSLAWRERSGTASPASPEEGRAFVRWLGSREGTRSYDEARRRATARIPKEFGRDELAAYGAPAPAPARPPAPAEPPRPVDHVDVYETHEGAVFLVVWDAGLSPEERVYVNVTGDQASFVQGGIHYGSVQNMPNAAVDLLREAKDATVVEIRRFGDRKEVKARHVAIVRSTSLSDDIGVALTRFKNAAGSPAKEAEWARDA